jgi:predicted dehydrogenase
VSGTGPVRVGVVGAGFISDQYLGNLTSFPDLRVGFVADIDLGRAESRADRYGIAGYGSAEELFARDDIEIVVNLTVPSAHFEVALEAVRAGKHVWNEKPIALDRASGRRLLDEAESRSLRVASAPDTILGAGLQSAMRLIRDGRIGEPLTALALMQSPGPDSWHPDPEFLFQEGGGPLFDVGPYYLTTLVQVFGPARDVFAASSTARPVRVIGAGPRAGTNFEVRVPTHHGALIRFRSGASAQVIFSFENYRSRTGLVEVSGSKGTLVLPDPNTFDGDSVVFDADHPQGETVPAEGSTSSRGTGVVELAQAIRGGRAERASGEQAFHVLDLMVAIAESAATGRVATLDSSFETAPPLDPQWDPTTSTLA